MSSRLSSVVVLVAVMVGLLISWQLLVIGLDVQDSYTSNRSGRQVSVATTVVAAETSKASKRLALSMTRTTTTTMTTTTTTTTTMTTNSSNSSNTNDASLLITTCQNRSFDVRFIPKIGGRWVAGAPKWYDSQFCCPRDPQCTDKHVGLGGSSCHGVGGINFRDEYAWQDENDRYDPENKKGDFSCASSSPTTPFHPESFCEKVGDRTVLVIGDSTMQQTFAVLKNALLVRSFSSKNNINSIVSSATCRDRIVFQHSDMLIPSLVTGGTKRERGKSVPLILQEFRENHQPNHTHKLTTTPQKDPDIVILSTGAHIPNLCEFIDVVSTLKEKIIPSYPDTVFVWKTQNPAGCSFPQSHRFQVFYPDQPEAATLDKDRVFLTHQYHGNFWTRDLIAMSMFSTPPGIQSQAQGQYADLKPPQQPKATQVLDLRMLYSRTDAHVYAVGKGNTAFGLPVDCLHYRSPGPLDTVVCAMYQLLQWN